MKRLYLFLLPLMLLAGCSLAEDVTPPPGMQDAPSNPPPIVSAQSAQAEVELRFPAEPMDLERGEALFAENCAACHGNTGLGDGPQAGDLPNAVPALGDPEVANMARPMDWYATVTLGKMDQFMPPFQSLDDSQRWDVVAYAISLTATAEDLEQGREIFSQECAACHGNQGQGTAAAPTLADPVLAVQNSGFEWYAAISKGLSGGMPAFEERLVEAQIWSLVAHLRDLAFKAQVAAAGDMPADTEAQTAESNQEEPLIGEIRGRVINGTQDAGNPQGLDVELHGFDGQSEVVSATSPVNADGTYSFDGLESLPGRLFVITVNYKDTVYGSDMAHLSNDGPVEMPITIYEATHSADALQVERLHMIFDTPALGVLQVIELWVFSNPSDQTILADADQGGLQIQLPEGSRNLQFEDGALGERFLATEAGFVDTAAIRPGEGSHQIVFSFDLDYDGEMNFSQSTGHPVDALILLAPPDGATLSGPGIIDMGAAQMGGVMMNTYGAEALQAGDALELSISGESVLLEAFEDEADGSSTGLAIGLGALGAVLVGIGAVWYRRIRKPGTAADLDEDLGSVEYPQTGGQVDLDVNQEDLLQQIAALDDAYAAGDLEEDDYQIQRDELKQHLLGLMR